MSKTRKGARAVKRESSLKAQPLFYSPSKVREQSMRQSNKLIDAAVDVGAFKDLIGNGLICVDYAELSRDSIRLQWGFRGERIITPAFPRSQSSCRTMAPEVHSGN